jgi:hypothetical protein
MPSLKRFDGELMVDHRASPGLPVDFYKPLGLDIPGIGEGKVQHMAFYRCSHCKGAVMLNPFRARERAYCQKCDHYICDKCHGLMQLPGYEHTPFVKLIDAVQAEQPNVTLLLSNIKGV